MIPSQAVQTAVQHAVNRTKTRIAEEAGEPGHEARLTAMARLQELYDQILASTITTVPYNVIDAPSIYPVTTSWQIFQLLEALQSLVEWLNSGNTAWNEARMIVEFDKIGRGSDFEPRVPSAIFPGHNISPAARRAILSIPFFADGMRGWVVEEIKTPSRFSPTMITITGSMGVTVESIPLGVWFNQMLQIWDIMRRQ